MALFSKKKNQNCNSYLLAENPAAPGANPPIAGLQAQLYGNETHPQNSTWNKHCYDVNECDYGGCMGTMEGSIPGYDTDAEKLCYNTVGSYECKCKNGWELRLICISNNTDSGIAFGSPDDVCVEVCFDIDECADRPCIETHTPHPTLDNNCANTVSENI